MLKKANNTYTGVENLEAMENAKNYNKNLIKIITGNKNVYGKARKVLDFGAGTGTYADMLKDKGIVVECLEPAPELVKILKKKGYRTHIDSKTLPKNNYDIIYALNVLEHIDKDKDIFDSLAKALKKDGRLIIYVPAFPILFSSMDKRVKHFRRYKKNRLRKFALDSGLKIETLGYCDPIGFAAALVYRLVGNKDGILSPGSVKLYDAYIYPISRAIEPIFKRNLGKNVVLIARK